MSIVDLYEPYYVPVSTKVIEPGHFCWVVAPHIQPIPQILDVERSNPEEHEKVSFSIRNANRPTDFRVSERILPLSICHEIKLTFHGDCGCIA